MSRYELWCRLNDLLYCILLIKRQLSAELFVFMFMPLHTSVASSAQLLQVTSNLWKCATFKKWYLPPSLSLPTFPSPLLAHWTSSFKPKHPCALLMHAAVKSADMSGGRPEVILHEDPTPVLGLCVPGFPLWAPPQFLAFKLGLEGGPHWTPDWTT